MKHTPTPWGVHVNLDGAVIYAEDGTREPWLIADVSGGFEDEIEQEANAAFIVKACNNHENLIGVIQAALRISDLWLPETADPEHVGEAEALHKMRNSFLETIKQAEDV